MRCEVRTTSLCISCLAVSIVTRYESPHGPDIGQRRDAARKAKEAKALGYECIKFKCTVTDPVADWCREIRESCGEGFWVVLDPNERFEIPANAERIARELEEIGNVLYLEDPIPRWNYDGWRYLRSKIHVPLSMHVSLPYLEMGRCRRMPRVLQSSIAMTTSTSTAASLRFDG